MAKPLRSQLNQIRAWVRQGRTDAWIAHQLEVSTNELREFRRRHELDAEDDDTGEVDLRDEIEAEIEAATREEELAAEAEPDEESDEEADSEKGADEGEPAADGETAEDGDGDAISPSAGAAGGAAGAGELAPAPRCRAPSTTARRVTGSGSTRRSRTIPSMPSTGPASGGSRSRSSPTGS